MSALDELRHECDPNMWDIICIHCEAAWGTKAGVVALCPVRVQAALADANARAEAEHARADYAFEALDKARAPEPGSDGQTHHEDCWRQRHHHACAVARVERVVAMLRRLEWSGYEGITCPMCTADRSEPHAPGCEMAALLR